MSDEVDALLGEDDVGEYDLKDEEENALLEDDYDFLTDNSKLDETVDLPDDPNEDEKSDRREKFANERQEITFNESDKLQGQNRKNFYERGRRGRSNFHGNGGRGRGGFIKQKPNPNKCYINPHFPGNIRTQNPWEKKPVMTIQPWAPQQQQQQRLCPPAMIQRQVIQQQPPQSLMHRTPQQDVYRAPQHTQFMQDRQFHVNLQPTQPPSMPYNQYPENQFQSQYQPPLHNSNFNQPPPLIPPTHQQHPPFQQPLIHQQTFQQTPNQSYNEPQQYSQPCYNQSYQHPYNQTYDNQQPVYNNMQYEQNYQPPMNPVNVRITHPNDVYHNQGQGQGQGQDFNQGFNNPPNNSMNNQNYENYNHNQKFNYNNQGVNPDFNVQRSNFNNKQINQPIHQRLNNRVVVNQAHGVQNSSKNFVPPQQRQQYQQQGQQQGLQQQRQQQRQQPGQQQQRQQQGQQQQRQQQGQHQNQHLNNQGRYFIKNKILQGSPTKRTNDQRPPIDVNLVKRRSTENNVATDLKKTSDVLVCVKPEIEEDEETKAYRIKIEEQKKLREKVLAEKEERRKQAALVKGTGTGTMSSTTVATVATVAAVATVSTVAPLLKSTPLQQQTQPTAALPNKNVPSQKNERSVYFNNRKVIAKDSSLLDTSLVIVSNLAAGTSEVKIRKLCQGVGDIQKLDMSPKGGQATIEFKSVASAHAFYKKYQRYMLDLSVIQVVLTPNNETNVK